MTKKLKICLLATVMVAGLVVFASTQVAAMPPFASMIQLTCPNNEAMRLYFDQSIPPVLVAAEWCSAFDTVANDCSSSWETMWVGTGYVCADADKTDCRQIKNSELFYGCGSPALGGTGDKISLQCTSPKLLCYYLGKWQCLNVTKCP
jgi:hypothetical protein